MQEHWKNIRKTIDRTLVSHSVSHFQSLKQKLHGQLIEDQKRGLAVQAEHAGPEGEATVRSLEELLTHPLCEQLTQKPVIYLHKDSPDFYTFENVILVPACRVSNGIENDPRRFRLLKADIAHELGHIISDDFNPVEQARDRHRFMNERMERRADLIAAHLCGDGGAALADSLESARKQEKAFQRVLAKSRSWMDRVTDRVVEGLHRQYPRPEKRIRYLRDWASRVEHGERLPDVDFSHREYDSQFFSNDQPTAGPSR